MLGCGKVKKKKEEELGKSHVADIDRDEDLAWMVADLWCLEKHLSTSLYFIREKLEKEPNNEYYKKLFQFVCEVLRGVRKERAKHLERLYFLREYGLWCSVKHILGAMMQSSEVMAKDLDIAIETNDERAWQNVKKDLETSKFCHDLILAFRHFSRTVKKEKK
mgnify:CR=1 FL=1